MMTAELGHGWEKVGFVVFACFLGCLLGGTLVVKSGGA